MRKFFMYFLEAFLLYSSTLWKNYPVGLNFLTEIQNLTKFIKTASENNKTKLYVYYSFSLA